MAGSQRSATSRLSSASIGSLRLRIKERGPGPGPKSTRYTRRLSCVRAIVGPSASAPPRRDRKSTRLNSSHDQISYAVFCLEKKTSGREDRRLPGNRDESAATEVERDDALARPAVHDEARDAVLVETVDVFELHRGLEECVG